jgi:hypothetical protein
MKVNGIETQALSKRPILFRILSRPKFSLAESRYPLAHFLYIRLTDIKTKYQNLDKTTKPMEAIFLWPGKILRGIADMLEVLKVCNDW